MVIGFIGTGHMGGSLAQIIGKEGKHDVLLCNRTPSKAEALKRGLGERTKVVDAATASLESDVLFLGVKPIDMDDVLRALPRPKGIVVSMAAGISITEIASLLPLSKIVRILPNTPVIIGKGITLVTFDESFSQEEKSVFVDLMKPTGKVVETTEDKLNPGGVITGSAPAYLDFFIDALMEGAKSLGLSQEEATDYVLSMCEGAIALAVESGKAPKKLGEEVCSPGGSTIEGVSVLLRDGLYETVRKACHATYEKNKKMR